ncbi:protein kinase [Brevibacterium marinum]|uniref:Protein kinase n=1 Tax=Brevibacterium marinum TaxID=418643 RepID=A0A846RV18_9MICO|nr:protein kinase [Brevibacterium marinum]NJC55816.1 hypothetical protein [Brevibacterium marinum]
MSDVPPRPRIRPATSADWHQHHSDRAGQTPSRGQGANQSAADFDDSTYYEYIERHTGDLPLSKNRSRNVFAPAGGSPFQRRSQAHPGGEAPNGGRSQPDVREQRTGAQTPRSAPVGSGSDGPTSGQIPLSPTPAPKKGNGAKITLVIIAIIMVLALLAFFGVRWLAPSTGTVPVDFNGDETESAPPSPTDTLVQPTATPEEALATYTKEGTAEAADLEGDWVTQVSAKNVGLEAEGKTWTEQDIVDEFETNRVKYPGAILIHSSDWGAYEGDDYWVTIIDTPYNDPEPALDQCRSWGLGRDDCIAKRLVEDGSPKGNSAYLDK